jgi:hypothetical protein
MDHYNAYFLQRISGNSATSGFKKTAGPRKIGPQRTGSVGKSYPEFGKEIGVIINKGVRCEEIP